MAHRLRAFRLQRAAAGLTPEQVRPGLRVRADVIHRLLPHAGWLALFRVDAVVQPVLRRGLPYVNYRDDPQPDKELVIGEAVIAPVGEQAPRLKPRVGRQGLAQCGGQFGGVVLVGRGDGEGQRDAVGGVGNQVHLVAEAPFLLALFGLGAVLEAPAGVRVADHLAVGIAVRLE